MGQPILLIAPKLLNILAGCVVLGLLLWRWLPLAVKERGLSEKRENHFESLAAIDFLTSIYNRRQFETLARAEISRCQRYMRPLSLLMIDVDHFKAVNDQFGHAAGDRVLQDIAAICRIEKRDPDILARIGGEEFAILLPETTEAAAVLFAERLRRQIHDSAALAVTVSIGVAGATPKISGIESLMGKADQALYEAKLLGRDRVAVSLLQESQNVGEAAE
jgi:diguanylate cyclase (GGDEF)-like protein